MSSKRASSPADQYPRRDALREGYQREARDIGEALRGATERTTARRGSRDHQAQADRYAHSQRRS